MVFPGVAVRNRAETPARHGNALMPRIQGQCRVNGGFRKPKTICMVLQAAFSRSPPSPGVYGGCCAGDGMPCRFQFVDRRGFSGSTRRSRPASFPGFQGHVSGKMMWGTAPDASTRLTVFGEGARRKINYGMSFHIAGLRTRTREHPHRAAKEEDPDGHSAGHSGGSRSKPFNSRSV